MTRISKTCFAPAFALPIRFRAKLYVVCSLFCHEWLNTLRSGGAPQLRVCQRVWTIQARIPAGLNIPAWAGSKDGTERQPRSAGKKEMEAAMATTSARRNRLTNRSVDKQATGYVHIGR
ncbi:unnamed protein product [Protopolystoma xenopodis]|uniref:Uncharacterized protein n=1 Tax=Protopolystoma xenopodis TaxID=117903 RepID=A0A3S5CBV7_9PLAT|nr:unnamed protein product [Protopolystoma xenopodis]